ncbi:MAG: hypothetical protein J7494_05160 [Sphingobium sp.]|nr:hypothetical protein [Sphingobium sp.]
MKRIVPWALLILVPAAASAADPNEATASSADAANPKPRKVCHQEVRTGTKFTTRICKTQDEWDAEAAKAKDTIDNWSRLSGGRYSGGTDGGGGARSGVGIGGM